MKAGTAHCLRGKYRGDFRCYFTEKWGKIKDDPEIYRNSGINLHPLNGFNSKEFESFL
jgi:hypothetical protein